MEETEYDILRQKNIAEKEAFFAEIFKELKEETNEIKQQKNIHHNKRYKRNTENYPLRRKCKISKENSTKWKGENMCIEFGKKYNTRNSVQKSDNYLNGSENKNDNKTDGEGLKLTVMFPWATSCQRIINLMKLDVFEETADTYTNNDERYNSYVRRKKMIQRVSKSVSNPESILSPDQVTDEMLKDIAEKNSTKIYCKVSGTCCHQCRQKTIDTKTICRSGKCIGIRGQFCGPCLRGRYGESAMKALKDPNWICPPCRSLCNCSICRTRNGQRPTGILAPVVYEEGFSSVKDYLESTDTNGTYTALSPCKVEMMK